jgi:glucose-1-phosphate thymidylyltransferase
VVEFKENNRVARVHEKPQEPPSAWACPALYFLQPSASERLDKFVDSAENLDELGQFIDFLCQKETVFAFKLNESRLDIGNLDAYKEADALLRKESLFE